MKRELQLMQEELSSARLIIKLLQAEGNIVNAIDTTTNQEMNYDARNINSNEWKTVTANKVGVKGQIPVQQPQPIPTIVNRYKLPDNRNIYSPTQQQREHANSLLKAKIESNRATSSVHATQQGKGREDYNKKTPTNKRSKIIIIEDSHARGCAQEIRHNLEQEYEIQGNVKPGANLQTIVNTPTESFEKLTNKDVVVVWGGTRDVRQNESEKGLRQIRNLVENVKHTNIIVMSVPYRHDLAPNSCVNHEVKVYNRKVKKHLKLHDNTCVLEVDAERDLFTRHGLHMNLKGKEHIAYKITKTSKLC